MCQQLATSSSGLHEGSPQRGMGKHNMGGGSPPLQVGQQLWGWLRRGLGARRSRCSPMADRQLHPFKTSGMESSCETQSEAS